MAQRPRLFLAEADGFDARCRNTQQNKARFDRVRASLAQGKVVFASATLIAVSLENDVVVREFRCQPGVFADDGIALRRDQIPVKREIDAFPLGGGARAFKGLQRGFRLDRLCLRGWRRRDRGRCLGGGRSGCGRGWRGGRGRGAGAEQCHQEQGSYAFHG